SKSAIDSPSTPAVPWLALTLLYASHTSLFGMSNGFALSTRFLPSLVDLASELNNAAPSVRPHYRALNPTAGCSAPVPRLGTLALMGASHLSFFLSIGATGSHVPCKSQPQSHAAFMPDVAWAIIRPPPRLVPGQRHLPGFDIVDTLSTHHQRFARARLSEPYLTGSRP